MSWILQLLINAGVLLLLANIMPSVKVKSYGTAICVALVIGLLNATIGWVIRFPLNLMTLWLLSFLVRLIVTALMIKLTDKLFSGFDVRGFWPAFIIAVVLALVGSLLAF
jgi:putative membrane protein